MEEANSNVLATFSQSSDSDGGVETEGLSSQVVLLTKSEVPFLQKSMLDLNTPR